MLFHLRFNYLPRHENMQARLVYDACWPYVAVSTCIAGLRVLVLFLFHVWHWRRGWGWGWWWGCRIEVLAL
jgi:hypothetical protein